MNQSPELDGAFIARLRHPLEVDDGGGVGEDSGGVSDSVVLATTAVEVAR